MAVGDYHVPPRTGIPEICSDHSCEFIHGGDAATALANFEKAFLKGDPAATGVAVKKSPPPQVNTSTASAAIGANISQWSNLGHQHTYESVADQVIVNGPGRNLPTATFHNRNIKTMNPWNGDGDTNGIYKKPGTNLIVLAQKGGKRARIVADNRGTVDVNAHFGRKVLQEKYGASITSTSDLYIVGYVDPNGNKVGFVPDKKVSAFTAL